MPGTQSPRTSMREATLNWRDAELAEVRFVRHGETRSYGADSGLTARGREQARQKGVALARQLTTGAVVWLPHAPTLRAEETAHTMRAALVQELADLGTAHVTIARPDCDVSFDNFRVWCGDRALDPTQAYEPYLTLRNQQCAGSQPPGWFVEMDRFVAIQAAGDDPITYWLTQPLQHFEPAASTVRRFWNGITARTQHAPPGVKVFVSTHSGCIRALAAAALGYDPGEPENTEDVGMRLAPGAGRALISYRGREVEMAAPAAVEPPWWRGPGRAPRTHEDGEEVPTC